MRRILWAIERRWYSIIDDLTVLGLGIQHVWMNSTWNTILLALVVIFAFGVTIDLQVEYQRQIALQQLEIIERNSRVQVEQAMREQAARQVKQDERLRDLRDLFLESR